MKWLLSATLVLAAISVLALLGLRGREGSLLVSPPPAVAATASARCPDHMLEDNGVCLPLPRATGGTKPSTPVTWVAAADSIAAFQVPWRDAPVPVQLAPQAPPDLRVLLLRTRVGSEIRCATSLLDPVIAHIGKSAEGTWVLTVSSRADKTRSVTIANLASLTPNAVVDSSCADGTPLGTSGDTLVVWEGTR